MNRYTHWPNGRKVAESMQPSASPKPTWLKAFSLLLADWPIKVSLREKERRTYICRDIKIQGNNNHIYRGMGFFRPFGHLMLKPLPRVVFRLADGSATNRPHSANCARYE